MLVSELFLGKDLLFISQEDIEREHSMHVLDGYQARAPERVLWHCSGKGGNGRQVPCDIVQPLRRQPQRRDAPAASLLDVKCQTENSSAAL